MAHKLSNHKTSFSNPLTQSGSFALNGEPERNSKPLTNCLIFLTLILMIASFTKLSFML